ncbi:Cell cycle checkpoint control protein RAD9A [Apodemus speciosus]|uniref:Cell cycle checkpoint control protein RAD9A n=1 Tax=Apodemus speciosus TaxID=105296 RepID=A0ABQ0FRW5_APOSI
MKCLITGANVKVLGKAVHSLSRIGDELYLEPLKDGLSLRTQYQAASPGQDLLRCKILMKSFLSVFRSLATVEKTVEKCCISFSGSNSHLVVQLHCKYGVKKTHNLSFQDCESLQAVFDPASCPHLLRTPARPALTAFLERTYDLPADRLVLAETVLSFPLALTEVTLGIGRGRRVILRSYQEEEAESTSKAMVTETSIGEEDFQQLHAPEGIAVTFCLKEFRGPVIFTIEDSLLDAHFVLATLLEPDSCSQDLCSPKPHQPVPQKQAHSTPHSDDFTSDDIDCYMIAMETTVGSEGSRVQPSTPLLPAPQASHDLAPTSEEEDEEAEPSTVPGTPPPKKFRSLFFGSILAPVHSPQGPNPVLAEDSDGEG